MSIDINTTCIDEIVNGNNNTVFSFTWTSWKKWRHRRFGFVLSIRVATVCVCQREIENEEKKKKINWDLYLIQMHIHTECPSISVSPVTLDHYHHHKRQDGEMREKKPQSPRELSLFVTHLPYSCVIYRHISVKNTLSRWLC